MWNTCAHMCYAGSMADDAVSVRELKANLSDYLRRVRDGEVIYVARHGWVCAELRAVETTKDTEPCRR